jgi:DNA replication protein DnaC
MPELVIQAMGSLVSGKLAWPLFLHGPAGTGKTCAALCLLDCAGGLYFTEATLCDDLDRARNGRLEWHHEGRGGTKWPEHFWADVARAPLVVLDEIALRNQVSDARYEATKRLIDERFGKPLVIISNCPLGGLAKLYDDRIVSRLGAGTMVNLKDEKDQRIA